MFKIIPLVISFALASSGAVAVMVPKVFSGGDQNLGAQHMVNVKLQSSETLQAQDSSDLFLSAHGVGTVNVGSHPSVNP